MRWRFVPPGAGSVNDVAGLPVQYFANGHQDGVEYVIDYLGKGPPTTVWTYQLESEPPCGPTAESSVNLADPPPELTNESG